MTKLKSVYKVPNGKLIRISLEKSGNKISALNISGDFFAYPENAIELIEAELLGKELTENNRQNLIELIESIVGKNSIELFGLDSESIVEALLIAR